jgi:hypothetical protein
LSATAALRLARLQAPLLRCLRQRHEVFARDRVLVLFAEELLLDEQIEGRRKRVCIAALKQADRVHVLLAAEDELFFFLSLDLMFPDRHGRRHDNRHHGDADNESSHGVPVVVARDRNGFALTS